MEPWLPPPDEVYCAAGFQMLEEGKEGWNGLAETCFHCRTLCWTHLCGFDLSLSPNKSGQSSCVVDEILGPVQDFEGPSSGWPGYLPRPESCRSFSENLPDSSEKTVQL